MSEIMDSESDEILEPDSESFRCKTKLCVFCASEINESIDDVDDRETDNDEGKTTFLGGLSIICERLNMESIYGTEEFWRLIGVHNFVKFVCCVVCLKILKSLVEFQELIQTTEKAITEVLQNVEHCIVQSSEKEKEFSLNSSFVFRNEIFKHFPNQLAQIEASAGSPPPSLSKAPAAGSKRKRVKVSKTLKNEQTNYCFVKLRKVDLEESNFPDSESIDESLGPEGFFEMDIKPVSRSMNALALQIADAVIEPQRQSNCDHQKKTQTKSGRPKSNIRKEFEELEAGRAKCVSCEIVITNRTDVMRNHLRVCKEKKKLETGKLINGEKVPTVRKPSHNNVGIKCRKRGRPKKVQTRGKEIVNKQHEKLQPKNKLRSGDFSEISTESHDLKSKRSRSVRVYTPSRRNVDDGPYMKPIVVINKDNAIYSYHNVRIRRVNTTLQCKYPDCTFCVENMAYFSDQSAFQTMKLHIRRTHRAKNNRKSTGSEDYVPGCNYACCHCDKQLKGKLDLLNHVKTSHVDSSPLPSLCEVCGDCTSSRLLVSHLMRHKNLIEKKMAEETKSKRPSRYKNPYYPCDQCDKVYTRKVSLRIHKESHIPIGFRKIFQCDLCGSKVSTLRTLMNHKERVHSKNKEALVGPFVCRICNKSYPRFQRTRYETHLRVHSGERPFQCSKCPKNFRSKLTLVSHESTHSDVKIQCEFCPNFYKNQRSLKNHHRKHHSDIVDINVGSHELRSTRQS